MATSRKPDVHVTYLRDHDRWLKKCRIAITVSKGTAMIFTHRRIQYFRPVQLFRETNILIDADNYLRVIPDSRLTCSFHIDKYKKKTAQSLGVLGPLLHKSIRLSTRNCDLFSKKFIRPMMQ
jgi:hypothetical protein